MFCSGTPANNGFNANCLRPYRSDMVSDGERRKPKKKTIQHEQIEIIVHIQLQYRIYFAFFMCVNAWLPKISSFNPAVSFLWMKMAWWTLHPQQYRLIVWLCSTCFFSVDLSCAYKRCLAGANAHTFFSVCGCFFVSNQSHL